MGLDKAAKSVRGAQGDLPGRASLSGNRSRDGLRARVRSALTYIDCPTFQIYSLRLATIAVPGGKHSISQRGHIMKANFKVAIALAAGAAIGGAAVQGLHAQAAPKAYVVTEIEVINQEAQAAYLPKVGEVIKSTGGTYLARGGKIVALEGEAPKRMTIVVYDNLEKAQASRNSPAWAALSAERNKAIKSKSYVTEGLPN
jgi:uncharacterized protein (DUF1330 family)